MDPETRVCPFCGQPPGPGVFCERCGRNLSSVERLPTAAELSAATRTAEPTPADAQAAVREFLDAMRAAGNPGTVEVRCGKPRAFGRTPRLTGWIVIPVEREDFEQPRRYEPGLLLSVDGAWHRLDSDLRGWGQRDFPRYDHHVSPEPVEPPPEERLFSALARLASEQLGG